MFQGPVVRIVDNFIQRINPHPAYKIGALLILIGLSKFCPLNRDLFAG